MEIPSSSDCVSAAVGGYEEVTNTAENEDNALDDKTQQDSGVNRSGSEDVDRERVTKDSESQQSAEPNDTTVQQSENLHETEPSASQENNINDEVHDETCAENDSLDVGEDAIQSFNSSVREVNSASANHAEGTSVENRSSSQDDEFDAHAHSRQRPSMTSDSTPETTDNGNSYFKERASVASSDVGAEYIDEPAPSLNVRFFRLASRGTSLGNSSSQHSNSQSISRRTTTLTNSLRPMSNIIVEESDESTMSASIRRRISMLRSSLSNSFGVNSSRESNARSNADCSNESSGVLLINARLVESMEEAEAVPMKFCQKHAKFIAAISVIILVTSITFVTLVVQRMVEFRNSPSPTITPSSFPSIAPSYDTRPTLAIVQERGSIRFGMHESASPGTFRYRLVSVTVVALLALPHAFISNRK